MTREEAIIILQENNPFMGDSTSRNLSRAMDMAVDALKAEKTGKWMKYEGRFDYEVECSECGCSSYWKSAYCPNCGAKLE